MSVTTIAKTPRVISVSEFRATIADVYEQFLAPTSPQPSEVWVKDLKQNEILFKVVPAFPYESEQSSFENYLAELEKTKGQLKFNTPDTQKLRRSFGQRLRKKP